MGDLARLIAAQRSDDLTLVPALVPDPAPIAGEASPLLEASLGPLIATTTNITRPNPHSLAYPTSAGPACSAQVRILLSSL